MREYLARLVDRLAAWRRDRRVVHLLSYYDPTSPDPWVDAIDRAAKALLAKGGGNILVPLGTFTLGRKLDLPAGVTLITQPLTRRPR